MIEVEAQVRKGVRRLELATNNRLYRAHRAVLLKIYSSLLVYMAVLHRCKE